MINPEQRAKLQKFFTDPDWMIVEQMIRDYIEPLNTITDIDASQDADTVRGEVLARKISYERLTKFLQEVGLVRKIINKKPTNFS